MSTPNRVPTRHNYRTARKVVGVPIAMSSLAIAPTDVSLNRCPYVFSVIATLA